MAASWVLKIPRSDANQGHILIHVSHKEGHPELDLTLLGTESEAVYKTKLRQKRARDLRSSKYTGSDDEWESILRHVFLLNQDPGISTGLRRSLETVAAMARRDGDRVLTITFRNRIDQITQKLGSIEFKETEEEIQLFDWASSAVDQQRSLQEKVSTLQSKAEADQSTMAALQAQVADLVKAKEEHEEQLISKFAVLLNEKKLKIRNQRRILSIAKVDKEKLAQLKLTIDSTTRRPTKTKRRAEAELEASDQEKDDSDDFETTNANPMPDAVGDDQTSRETTPETEIDSEGESSVGQPATSIWTAESPNSKTSKAQSEIRPPPRQLPFVKKGPHRSDETATSKLAEPVMGGDEETVSEDDEL